MQTKVVNSPAKIEERQLNDIFKMLKEMLKKNPAESELYVLHKEKIHFTN